MILCPYFPCLKMFFSFFTGVGVGDWVPFKERTLWNPRGFIPILNHGLSPFSSSREKPNIWRILSRASSLFFLLKLEILPQSLLFLVTKSVMNWNSSPPSNVHFLWCPRSSLPRQATLRLLEAPEPKEWVSPWSCPECLILISQRCKPKRCSFPGLEQGG